MVSESIGALMDHPLSHKKHFTCHFEEIKINDGLQDEPFWLNVR